VPVAPAERGTHLAIGEVLSLLQEDFPDVTISKIRFLESQGLISPERTASGYRKFYDDDIRRLQWVLRQQKERFLPLKVIKAKLDAGEDLDHGDEGVQPSLFGEAEPPPAPTAPAAAPSPAPEPPAPASPAAPPARPADLVEAPDTSTPPDPAAWLAALQEAPPRRRAPSRPLDPPLDLSDEGDGATYDAEQVCEKSGIGSDVLDQLVDFGLVRAGTLGG
jgi:DNA-binding transcriptional MerR regulator